MIDLARPSVLSDAQLADRLRDVLSDAMLKDMWSTAGAAMAVAMQHDFPDDGRQAAAEIMRNRLASALLPLLSSLQEEREREIRAGLKVIYTALRSDEKGEFWAVRRWLDKQGVFNDDLSGLRVVEAAAKQLLSRLAQLLDDQP